MEHRTEYERILVTVQDSIATITLHAPERKNALGATMVNDLLWALDDARDDPGVRVIVLTGSGKAFSAGADLSQLSAGDKPKLALRGDYADLLLRFAQLGKPVIARVPGPALGGGLGLVASADVAIAAASAVLGTPELHRGLFPMQIMAVLERLVPRRKLVEMMLLGEKLSAQSALEWGLLTRVVPDEQLDAEVDVWARKLAAHSPTAMRMGLRAFHELSGQPLELALPLLRDAFVKLLATNDAREGLAAFAEKRQPRWTGR